MTAVYIKKKKKNPNSLVPPGLSRAERGARPSWSPRTSRPSRTSLRRGTRRGAWTTRPTRTTGTPRHTWTSRERWTPCEFNLHVCALNLRHSQASIFKQFRRPFTEHRMFFYSVVLSDLNMIDLLSVFVFSPGKQRGNWFTSK